MTVGDTVRVLPPFASSFGGEYVIEREEGGVFFLAGIEGGFAATYLELV